MTEPHEDAVLGFWSTRAAQAAKNELEGKADQGERGAITGGKHLDPIRELIAELFVSAGVAPENIYRSKGITLPGYYRPSKDWDLVVTDNNRLIAAIELKSQVGPSFGNNFNNRTEEALGNATDIWRAFQEGSFGELRPWLGYVFVLEEAAGSIKAVRLPRMQFPPDPEFIGSSYKDRYGILCERLIRERLYDAVWFVSTSADGSIIDEPKPGLRFSDFKAALLGRVAQVQSLGEN